MNGMGCGRAVSRGYWSLEAKAWPCLLSVGHHSVGSSETLRNVTLDLVLALSAQEHPGEI